MLGRGSSFSRRFTSSTGRWATARMTLARRSLALPLLYAHLRDYITGLCWLLRLSVPIHVHKLWALPKSFPLSPQNGQGFPHAHLSYVRTDIPSSQHRGRSAQHVLLLPVFSVLTHPFQLPFASADRLGDRLSLFNGYPIFASKASC